MKHSYSKVAVLTLIMLSMAAANANDDGDILPTPEENEAATDPTPGSSLDELIQHSQDNIDKPAAQTSVILNDDGDILPKPKEIEGATDHTPDDSLDELIKHSQDNIDKPEAQTSAILPVPLGVGYLDAFSHTVILLLDNPRKDEAWSQVISSQDEWEAFYNAPLAYMTFSDTSIIPAAPVFDFEKYQILAGGLGVRYSSQIGAEHVLSVEKVLQTDTELVIYAHNIGPCLFPDAPAQAVPQPVAFPSYPATAVLVKKTDKPFRFELSNLIDIRCR